MADTELEGAPREGQSPQDLGHLSETTPRPSSVSVPQKNSCLSSSKPWRNLTAKYGQLMLCPFHMKFSVLSAQIEDGAAFGGGTGGEVTSEQKPTPSSAQVIWHLSARVKPGSYSGFSKGNLHISAPKNSPIFPSRRKILKTSQVRGISPDCGSSII